MSLMNSPYGPYAGMSDPVPTASAPVTDGFGLGEKAKTLGQESLIAGASTRSESYAAVRASGTDVTQQDRVLAFLRGAGPAIKDRIVDALGFRASSVTARLNELVKLGRVVEKDIVFNPVTRRNVTLYAAEVPA